MVTKKWGESFLKSGLPLEHLTAMTFRSLGWLCTPSVEYQRVNRDKEETWFEVDLEATYPKQNRILSLNMIVECKYHDMSRFWFFLPHEKYRWYFDDRILNTVPFQTLASPRLDTFLSLAPLSSGGVVVSETGEKQDNSVRTALEQLSNAFVPLVLRRGVAYNLDSGNYIGPEPFIPSADAFIPVIVTNAKIYRLKTTVSDLDMIRRASSPTDIAEELKWTWCYYEPSMSLYSQNCECIERHINDESRMIYKFPGVEECLQNLAERPNWIAVVNIRDLASAVSSIQSQFRTLRIRSMSSLVIPRQKKGPKKKL